MPYALYSTTTGQIFNVLYQLPTNSTQLAALAAQGMAFSQVPAGIGPGNSMIDLGTGSYIPTGPQMTYYYRYEFDATGFIGHSGSGNIPLGDPQLTNPNTILSTSPLPLQAGMMLTLDEKGKPTKDASGNYIAEWPVLPPSPPDPFTLLITAAVNSGNLDPSIIPDKMLTAMNTSLTAHGGIAIEAQAKPALAISAP